MKIGYACLTQGVRATNFRTCILKNADEENLKNIIDHNLKSLENIIKYNIENHIKLFRISSDIIPFGSSPANTLKWWDMFEAEFNKIGSLISQGEMRVSMHPGQYTVLNSNKVDVINRAIEDLEYHTRFLDSLNLNENHKIILHIGGVYGEKDKAMDRFIESYQNLNDNIKKRLVIENDDRSYNIEEVLAISKKTGIPVIYDNLHNKINVSNPNKTDNYWIKKTRETWKIKDGRQKIHYSQQDKTKRAGAHSPTIRLEEFVEFKKDIDYDIDIMLEVKDKNLSAIKVINAYFETHIKNLELEWSKYKYSVLEKSPKNYNEIRELLKDKEAYPALAFYKLIEESLEEEDNLGHVINGLQHVWGYFKKDSSHKEKEKFENLVEAYKKEKVKKARVKNYLEKLALKYEADYLLDSYYFHV